MTMRRHLVAVRLRSGNTGVQIAVPEEAALKLREQGLATLGACPQ